MKYLINILILCISLHALSQNLECYKTIQEVQQAINGDWKLKNGNQNITYRFIFNDDKGVIEVLKELNLPPKAADPYHEKSVMEEQTTIDLKLDNGVFFIELTNLQYGISEPIYVLNEEYFIYGKGDSEHVFVRD